MGDYDYLGRTPPPRSNTDSDFPITSDDPGNFTVDGTPGSPVTTPMLFPDGATRAVTFHPDVPHPSGSGSGPAVMIHATRVSMPSQQAGGLSVDPGNGQIVTAQQAQAGTNSLSDPAALFTPSGNLADVQWRLQVTKRMAAHILR